ncbi:DUF4097 family beta strand repeat-containing protein [Paenibacillus septentrionalis]|uniref:DUF4097 family beta strand repeat-containing protein n=1 Tax=Paenibacillus septentrionalis TaxID=429342 RepID=A0ABW1VBY9_9BACL
MNKQTLLGIVIVIIGAVVLFTNVFDLEFRNTKGEKGSQLYDAQSINELTVRTSSVNVKLLPSESESIQLKLYDSNHKSYDISSYVSTSQYSNALDLTVKSPRKWYLPFQFKSYTLELIVPTQLVNTLNVETNSGNIRSDRLDVEMFALEANSGNITLNDITSTDLSAHAKSGNITIDQLDSSTLSLHANSGNAKATSFKAEHVEVEVNSGNITLIGDAAGLDATAKSGNINAELQDLTKDSSIQANSGNVKLILHKQPSSLAITHRKGSGNSSVSKSGFEITSQDNDRLEGKFGSGDVKLDVQTKSGNFSLR